MVELKIGEEVLELSWEQFEARVRTGRVPPDAQLRIEAVTDGEWVEARTLESYESLLDDKAIAWRGQFLQAGPPVLTALLVGMNIRTWWLSWWSDAAQDVVVYELALYSGRVLEDGEAWRLWTMGFSHTAAFHLALNMLWLAYTGANIERALGRRNLLLLYMASVTLGSLMSMFGTPENGSLGASGGVFGLVAASVVFGFTRPQLLPERGRQLFGWALVPYLVLMFGSGLASPDTDNWAHFGGLVAGGTLALVLDPPGLQRRPGWNTAWHLALVGSMAALLGVLWLGGPRLVPMSDSQTVRVLGLTADQRLTAGQLERGLSWQVPEAWATSVNPAGDLGFSSRHSDRSFGVKENRSTNPVPLADLADGWRAKVTDAWPEAVFEGSSCDLAGGEAQCLQATLPTDPPRLLLWRGRSRGLWTLQAVYEVEAWARAGLAPLERRLWAGVVWEDPAGLESARIHYEHRPTASRGRDVWATQLAEVGRVQEAMDIRESLVSDYPDEPAWWSGLLQLVEWYPDQTDARGVWTRALKTHPSGPMAAVTADAMEAAGNTTGALGLLEIAWTAQPGERSLKRARRSRDLSISLEHATPWRMVYDPATGLRREVEVEDLAAVAWTIDEAERVGATLVAERDGVIDAALAALVTPEADLLTPMRWLRNGTTAPDPEVDQRMARDLVRALESDRAPKWIPGRVLEGMRARPERVRALVPPDE